MTSSGGNSRLKRITSSVGFARCFAVRSLIFFLLASSAAADWPAGDVVYAASKSPDGHYGIVLPGNEAATGEGNANYLADLTNHQLLGQIAGADYFERENHRDLHVIWSPESKWCVVTYGERYGFGSIGVLEPHGSTFTQTDLGEHVQKALNSVIASQAHDKDAGCYGMPYFRVRADGKILVRAVGYTNPKSFDNVMTYYAFFAGTFDLKAKKWTASSSRQTGTAGEDLMDGAYDDYRENECIVLQDPAEAPEDFAGTIVNSEDRKAEYVEQRLNQVYAAIRFALPAQRFAKLKQDQIAWLKKRDALDSMTEKCKMTEARVKWLQDLLW